MSTDTQGLPTGFLVFLAGRVGEMEVEGKCGGCLVLGMEPRTFSADSESNHRSQAISLKDLNMRFYKKQIRTTSYSLKSGSYIVAQASLGLMIPISPHQVL